MWHRLVAFTISLLFCTTVAQDGPLTAYPDCVSGPLAKVAICDPKVDELTRALSLIALLNVSEKITRIGQSYGANEIKRIGLPPYHWRQNAIHGLGPGVIWTTPGTVYSNATEYPHVINLGATFDRQLFTDVGTGIADEARAFANVGRAGLDWFTPNINIYRDPRWGRGQETPGEDVLLTSEFAVNFVQGLQGGEDSRYKKVLADIKHYAGYDLEHWGNEDRASYNAIISQQDLAETYLPPFEAGVRDGKSASLMCSYNRVNGVPSCANPFFIQTILREHWGAEKYTWVVSDCNAIAQIFTAHHYTKTEEEAVAVALHAGVDLDCGPWYSAHGMQAYNEKLINDTDLDRALTRLTVSLIRLGYFDPAASQPYRQIGPDVINSPKHEALALKAAQESLVLLKNDKGLLPFDVSSYTRVALIGPNANATEELLGNYQSPVPYFPSILDELKLYSPNLDIRYESGCAINSTSTSGFAAAVAAAAAADITIFVGGLDQSIEAEGKDRYRIDFPGQQLPLIQQLASASKRPILVVTLGGGQVDMTALKSNDKVGAVLWIGYPGQSGGKATVDVIMGNVSPSGRLPVTQYPAAYVSVPMTDQSMRPNTTSGSPGRTYKFYTQQPVYAFGDGLSYSTFLYEQLAGEFETTPSSFASSVSKSPRHLSSAFTKHVYNIADLASSALLSDRNADIAYFVNITNQGPMLSDVTALAFVSATSVASQYDDVSPPIKQLFDFQHLRDLQVGETRQVWFQMSYRSLLHTDKQGHQWLLPGQYHVTFNNAIDLEHSFELMGAPTLIRKWPGGGHPVAPRRSATVSTIASS